VDHWLRGGNYPRAVARACACRRWQRGPLATIAVGASVLGLVAGCGGGTAKQPLAAPPGAARLDAADQPRTIGAGPLFLPPALGPAVAAAAGVVGPAGILRCATGAVGRYGAHLELFAAGHVVVIPAGIGIAPPQRRQGAFVTGGRCSYPLRTVEPTGVIEVAPALLPPPRTASLADLFAEWGQPLSARRLAGFTARGSSSVVGYVDGRRWPTALGVIPVLRHTQIVLEVNGAVLPHRHYRFQDGL
jgi:hypothetical protein